MSSDSQDQSLDGANRRRQAFSLSLALRSPRRKRNSIMRPPPPPPPPPTCAEQAHYPVFNPQDPRHNPTVANSSLVRSGYVPQMSSSQRSVRWMQSLPRRSLRKARSGFFALRSGMQRRANNRKGGLPEIWLSSDTEEFLDVDQQDLFSSSMISLASTLVDPEFGVDLYRIKCNCPSPFGFDTREYMLRISSSSSLTLISPFTLPELDIEPSKSAGSAPEGQSVIGLNLENKLQVQISKVPPKKQIKWRGGFSQTTTDTETSGCTVSEAMQDDSPKDNVPQIKDRKPGIEPPFLFDRPDSGVDPTIGLDSHYVDNPPLDCAQDTADVVTILADVNQNESRDEQSQVPGARDNLIPVSTEAFTENTTGYSSATPDHPSATEDQASTCSLLRQENADLSSDQSTHLNYRSDEGTTTERTSLSINQWSPVDNNDDWLPLSFRDEFFLVDGKTNDFRHDRGDNNATKTEKRIPSDGSINSGLDVNRYFPSRGNRFVPEIIGPGGPLLRRVSRPRIERVHSDSTDEYIPAYPVFPRRYRS